MKMTSQTFTQEMHCCGSNDEQAEIRLVLFDGGGGDYLVMHASHWSFDDPKQVDELCVKLKSMIPFPQTATP